MGIKHLWSILSPYSERKPLYELENKTVAVDLSCWICQAQHVTVEQPKNYLRNLYFRTCFLLLMGVKPVFVLDGKPPELKHNTIAARNALQFKGTSTSKKPQNRSHFKFVLNLCEEMLRLMGLTCVKGEGEAEALCAYLNEHGFVDGCISQDSDCFAYGARVVYRNFSVHEGGGIVDVYDLHKITDSIGLGRNKVVALALFCGSDYNDGVCKVGKESVLKLFEHVNDAEILQQVKAWRNNKYYDETAKMSLKNVCMVKQRGCGECKTKSECKPSQTLRAQIKNELGIRMKALADPNFPNTSVIDEFLNTKDKVKEIDTSWKGPDLANFVKFAGRHMKWEIAYAFQKFLPILARWNLLNDVSLRGPIVPELIKKVKKIKGVPCYEIVWSDPTNAYNDLTQSEISENMWTTIEPQCLVHTAYPTLAESYDKAKKKPPKRKKKIEDMLANVSITDPPKPKRKRKPQQTNTLDSYLTKPQHNDTDLSRFGDEDDYFDLSEIVDRIVSQKQPSYVEKDLHAMGYCSTPKNRPPKLVESSFFGSVLDDEEDLFEQSMRVEVDGDKTEDDENDTFSETYVPLLTRLKNKML